MPLSRHARHQATWALLLLLGKRIGRGGGLVLLLASMSSPALVSIVIGVNVSGVLHPSDAVVGTPGGVLFVNAAPHCLQVATASPW